MSTLEELAERAWIAWGEFAKFTVCDGCDRGVVVPVYCRAHRRNGHWLCLDCFDLSDGAECYVRP